MGLQFVGQERASVVDRVVAQWDACRREKRSELVLIEGHPGVGKTRIVQEFYERLRDTQPSPAYWPSLLDAQPDTSLQDRGRIRPSQFQCPPGAKPSYAWVAITCRLDEMSGEPLRALVDAVGASEALMERVIHPLGRRRRVLGQITRSSAVLLGLVVAVLGLVGVGGLFAVIAGFVVAAMAVAFELREQVARASREVAHVRRERTRQDILIDVAKPLVDVSLSAHARASGFLGALAKRGIPGVIVIDDAQWADPDTVSLIDALLARALPILVVATARPTPFEQQVHDRVAMGQIVRDYSSKTTRFHLDPLTVDELSDAVMARAPRTDRAVIRAIAEHANGNPLVLAGTLDQPVVRRSLVDGAITMSDPARDLANMPTDPRGVFESYWEQLPEDVSQIVALATIQGHFVEPDALCAGYEDSLGGRAQPALERARDPFFWLASLAPHLDTFADPILLDVAARHALGVISQSEMDTARASMIGFAVEIRRADQVSWDDFDANGRRALLRLHVGAAQSGTSARDRDAAESAIELATLLDGPAEASSSLAMAQLGLEWSGGQSDLIDEARTVSALRLNELGHVGAAIEVLDAQIEYRTRALGAFDRATLDRRRERISLLRNFGRVDDALRLGEELVPVLVEHLGHDDEITLLGRRDLAIALRLSGRLDQAIANLTALISDESRVLGPTSEHTLRARNEVAQALRDLGRFAEAIAEFRAVLAIRIDLLGTDHPDTLKTRSDLTTTLLSAGQLDEAYAEAQAVLALREQVIGPDHPETMRTRSTIMAILWQMRRLDEAIELAQAILSDRLRVLGPRHPDTLRSRNNLGAMLGSAGRTEEALREFDALLDDQQQLFGLEHPDTLRTLRNKGCALIELDRFDEGVAILEELSLIEQRVLGPTHPESFSTRREIADALRRRGDAAQAVAAYSDLSSAERLALGSAHPDVYRTLRGLARALDAAADTRGAEDVLRRAHDDAHAHLGADHPQTREITEALHQYDQRAPSPDAR